MERAEKAAVVADLNAAFSRATCLYLADYRGLTVEEANDLRRRCRAEGVTYRVVKNTLAKLALEGTDKAALAGSFSGPVAVAWTEDDPVGPAKVLTGYAKDNDALELKEAVVEGRALSPEDVGRLAKLPGRDALRSQFLSLLIAPMQQMVSVIAAPARDVVGVIDAYAQKLGDNDNG